MDPVALNILLRENESITQKVQSKLELLRSQLDQIRHQKKLLETSLFEVCHNSYKSHQEGGTDPNEPPLITRPAGVHKSSEYYLYDQCIKIHETDLARKEEMRKLSENVRKNFPFPTDRVHVKDIVLKAMKQAVSVVITRKKESKIEELNSNNSNSRKGNTIISVTPERDFSLQDWEEVAQQVRRVYFANPTLAHIQTTAPTFLPSGHSCRSLYLFLKRVKDYHERQESNNNKFKDDLKMTNQVLAADFVGEDVHQQDDDDFYKSDNNNYSSEDVIQNKIDELIKKAFGLVDPDDDGNNNNKNAKRVNNTKIKQAHNNSSNNTMMMMMSSSASSSHKNNDDDITVSGATTASSRPFLCSVQQTLEFRCRYKPTTAEFDALKNFELNYFFQIVVPKLEGEDRKNKLRQLLDQCFCAGDRNILLHHKKKTRRTEEDTNEDAEESPSFFTRSPSSITRPLHPFEQMMLINIARNNSIFMGTKRPLCGDMKHKPHLSEENIKRIVSHHIKQTSSRETELLLDDKMAADRSMNIDHVHHSDYILHGLSNVALRDLTMSLDDDDDDETPRLIFVPYYPDEPYWNSPENRMLWKMTSNNNNNVQEDFVDDSVVSPQSMRVALSLFAFLFAQKKNSRLNTRYTVKPLISIDKLFGDDINNDNNNNNNNDDDDSDNQQLVTNLQQRRKQREQIIQSVQDFMSQRTHLLSRLNARFCRCHKVVYMRIDDDQTRSAATDRDLSDLMLFLSESAGMSSRLTEDQDDDLLIVSAMRGTINNNHDHKNETPGDNDLLVAFFSNNSNRNSSNDIKHENDETNNDANNNHPHHQKSPFLTEDELRAIYFGAPSRYANRDEEKMVDCYRLSKRKRWHTVKEISRNDNLALMQDSSASSPASRQNNNDDDDDEDENGSDGDV